jgi:hypothetical protein
MRYIAIISLLAVLPVAHAFRCSGPAQHKDVVRKGYMDTYRECFKADMPAVVGATGDGDIDIFIYDRDGKRVAYDVAADGTPAVAWRPKYTGIYVIQIRNCENRNVSYTIRIP